LASEPTDDLYWGLHNALADAVFDSKIGRAVVLSARRKSAAALREPFGRWWPVFNSPICLLARRRLLFATGVWGIRLPAQELQLRDRATLAPIGSLGSMEDPPLLDTGHRR
jgi:hypothetical protein